MSALTFLNTTQYIAQFVVNKGEQVVARLPGIAPGASLQVPSDDTYQVTASTILEGNTYTSAPATVSGAMGFVAQVKQNNLQGTYDFEMKVEASSAADQMVFQKTTIGPVTFNISKNGVYLQSVVVQNSFLVKTLQIGSTYSMYAVINGVTTDTAQTTNPSAVVTAELDNTDLESGYFTLSAL
ncbi:MULTISPECIES: hypothetical protein [Paraburkholderia]|uniref:Uncharacterized protein n=1 Tax=Paraburkholderia megapolitana TaxID=420953 RepID=A0A1I3DNU4_9BURK|nr:MULTISPECIES: hypothetical protein [Paraburkholderia]MCX4161518.1 hypothetical protein [Paraburkholderia megapolitana]MDN7157014.1 hypothetical protein [Paraburkholderia sp. CHISQ3]MDQ6494059.1 hypothetical protein [Paraburkholderia megapolitana]QDQ79691.1 hypothetical protein FNZ07_00070 [Paraburkholderia megapolitana]SFH88397.1 hypothetical protein SAMN05192543_101438 [Paraburkholderia megapolitana]